MGCAYAASSIHPSSLQQARRKNQATRHRRPQASSSSSSPLPSSSTGGAPRCTRTRSGRMRSQRVANAGPLVLRGYKSTGLLRLLVSPPQQSKVRLRCYAVMEMTGGGERSRARAPAGGAELALWALVACNVASLALLLRSYIDRRPRPAAVSRGRVGAARSSSSRRTRRARRGSTPSRRTPSSTPVVIPGWQAMRYFSDPSALCSFIEPAFEREVRRLRRLVGNAVIDGYHLVVGTGATQLFQTAMYGLSSPARGDEPVAVVSPAPYYSVRSQKHSVTAIIM
ncbi:tryptophan aminotransferase-related protein 2-like [Phragmites australis]|uniref:tryptophan aminotransferase-related protein 2-like n=1 Tax=Phragmites australis TaxID=29695 RepID=UPI002D792EB1|nr:tryptophan aminotransferase-related protein 2-like [Phragmites australis]